MTATAMPVSMSGTLLGMDTEEVAALGTRLVSDAAEMERIVADVRALVDGLGSFWGGPDFTAYHAEWLATHAPALALVATGLREHGQVLLAQAQQQDQASAALDGVEGAAGAAGALAGAAAFAGGAGASPKAADRDLLMMAAGSYQDNGDVVTPTGTYHRVTDTELRAMGLDPSRMITADSGFAAALYKTPQGGYVLAYRGTDDNWVGPDGPTNVVGGIGITGQSRQAIALAQQVSGAVGAENLQITGHSLGGRLASVASIATGAPAVTFNAAGVSDPEFAMALRAGGRSGHVAEVIGKYGAMTVLPAPAAVWLFGSYDPFAAERAALTGGQIRSFHVDGEVLSTLQDATPMPDALGSRTELPDSGSGASTLGKHGTEEVIRSWDRAYPPRQPVTGGLPG